MNKDVIEFYDRDKLIVTVHSSIVPMVGSKISIRKKTWAIVSVTYAVDCSDNSSKRTMRANVELKACK